ncbi:hypothetical protein [Paraburkholderia sp. BR14374]|uniref:hypothetical protein n=1 Tax=Paraburkholderia sp. BR14374 TaxID=3237007 RepID=UPI0034CF39F4
MVDAHALDLGLVFDEREHRVVVISHDCDLANDKEPSVECIVADIVATVDPPFARARNVRRLHLSYTTGEGHTLVLELRHEARTVVDTVMFDAIAAAPDASVTLNADEKRALKQWLAARYGRPAFPNAFESRLRRKHKGKTVEQLTGKLLEPYNAHLVGVFFDLDAARFQDLDGGEPYVLRITLAYDATEGGPVARAAAEKAASEISDLFTSVYGKPEDAKEIALESCVAVADTRLSLADLRKIDQWRLEYISLRTDPPEGFLPVGETPA